MFQIESLGKKNCTQFLRPVVGFLWVVGIRRRRGNFVLCDFCNQLPFQFYLFLFSGQSKLVKVGRGGNGGSEDSDQENSGSGDRAQGCQEESPSNGGVGGPVFLQVLLNPFAAHSLGLAGGHDEQSVMAEMDDFARVAFGISVQGPNCRVGKADGLTVFQPAFGQPIFDHGPGLGQVQGTQFISQVDAVHEIGNSLHPRFELCLGKEDDLEQFCGVGFKI